MANIENIKQMLAKYNQEHLLKFYEELNEEEKQNLLEQIEQIDFEQIKQLYKETKNENEVELKKIEPMKYIDKYKLLEEKRKFYEQIGSKIIENGEYAVATMAGGQRNTTRTYRT